MVDLSIVQDEKLRDLIANSKRFQMMPEDSQANVIAQFNGLPEPEQKKFLEFFIGAVKEEKNDEKKLKRIEELTEELRTEGPRLIRMVREDKENQEVKADKEECEDLLDQLGS